MIVFTDDHNRHDQSPLFTDVTVVSTIRHRLNNIAVVHNMKVPQGFQEHKDHYFETDSGSMSYEVFLTEEMVYDKACGMYQENHELIIKPVDEGLVVGILLCIECIDFFKSAGEVVEDRFAMRDDRFAGYGHVEFATPEAIKSLYELNDIKETQSMNSCSSQISTTEVIEVLSSVKKPKDKRKTNNSPKKHRKKSQKEAHSEKDNKKGAKRKSKKISSDDESEDDGVKKKKKKRKLIPEKAIEDGDQSEEKSGNTNNYEDDSCYEFQDEEGFLAVLGISYQKILNEKHNLERVLRKGIEKYPNSEALKDWKIKMNREFKLEEMEEETERFENDDVQDEETQTEEEIPEHDEGKGKELVVIQEAEHLNHISPEIENINNENEDGYITPIPIRVENLESTQSLSSTQFFEQPGVLEEVEDMLLKATTKSNEDKPKMNEEAEKRNNMGDG
ncbi:hypothetical protein L1887_27794 [Cichorium endivia]|nr:hypothetical protein L1887_27794 [Cichorium endivia]